jgi:hypothetical protein
MLIIHIVCVCVCVCVHTHPAYLMFIQEALRLGIPKPGWLSESPSYMFLGLSPETYSVRTGKSTEACISFSVKSHLCNPPWLHLLYLLMNKRLKEKIWKPLSHTTRTSLYNCTARSAWWHQMVVWISTLMGNFPLRFIGALWANTELRASCLCISGLSYRRRAGFKKWIIWKI